MKRCFFVVSLLTVACLAACVNQEKEVAIYRDVLTGHAPVTTRPAGLSFEADQSLSLSEAMALAARDNERLSLSGEDYLQALIAKDRTFANFLPVISFAPTYFTQEKFSSAKTPLVRQHSFDAPVSLQSNFNGVRDWSSVEAAGLTADQRRELLLDLQSTVLLETARTYYQAVVAEKSVDVLTHTVQVQDAHVRDLSLRVAQGVARALDVQQAQAQLAATRVQLTDARTEITRSRATLAFLVGVPAVRGRLADVYTLPDTVDTLDDLFVRAAAKRFDLKGARLAVSAARQAVTAAIAEYYPAVSIDLNAFLAKESLPADSSFNGVIGLQVPIFTGGRIHADVRAAWSAHRQASLALSLLERQVRQQVEIARADVVASVQRVTELETEVAAASEAARIVGVSHDSGVATNLDYLDAQDRLLAAQLQLARARCQRVVDHLNLRRVSGDLDGPNAASPVSSTIPGTQP
jgi:outer membrane protein